MLAYALVPLAAAVARANAAATNVGALTSDVFPVNGTAVNTAVFPAESAVGFPGATATGVEPAAIQTAPAYATNDDEAAAYPLIWDKTKDNKKIDTFKYWGNLSPWYSVSSAAYGLPDASPKVPEGCDITQVHLLYRHGARYPTSGSIPSAFAGRLHNATLAKGSFTASGELDFLNKWTYELGAELLTPFGRLQNFELGVAFRQQYGKLLNNFTEQGALPVFRTESQDRMVKTAENFAAGLFGVPEYLQQVNIEIVIETSGLNNSGAPYETCANSNVGARGSIGTAASAAFATNAFNKTLDRLNKQISNYQFTPTDVIGMLELCAYETDSLGYSHFCKLFTEEDFKNLEYFFDIQFYYNNGPGSPVAAAQGLGYLQEFLSRFTQTPLKDTYSTTNLTLDDDPVYFPLNQSIYADATHEVVVLDTLVALNLTSIFGKDPLNYKKRAKSPFVASQVVPFATHLVMQVLGCPALKPTKQMRFIVNDAVVPIHESHKGCPKSKDGLCSFDNVVSVLQKRAAEIDYTYDCFGNYTATVGQDYNGRAPK